MNRHSCFLVICFIVLMFSTAAQSDDIPTRFDAAPRIVAFGDVHGDLNAARSALRLGGAIDENDNWIGGELVVVQTGDQLDRGDDEQAIIDMFSRLIIEAAAAGGAFHVLNGNHELMNAKMDLRYVTPGGFKDFEDAVSIPEGDTSLAGYEAHQRARVVAMRPGGRYAKVFSERNTMVIVGDNVFVHGGITPQFVDYGIERMNEETRSWLRGDAPIPEWFLQKGSPVWSRHFSDEVDASDCDLLADALKKMQVKRMIVGHTVQIEGITPFCSDQVWCIDVGMAAHYGGQVQVLEIVGDQVRALNED